MENIIRYPSNRTPFVYTNYNQGVVYVAGVSIPENAPQFFAGLTDWLVTFIAREKRLLQIHIDLDYFSNSSSLCISDIIRQINTLENKWVSLLWYYYSNDDDVREDGEDFSEIATFSFQLISVERHDAINISKTNNTPLIYFDLQGDYIIHGNATRKEPLPFYLPVIKWLQTRRTNSTPQKVTFEIFLNQISVDNFPFLKALCHFVEILENKGIKSTIIWKYSNAELEQTGIEMLHDIKIHYFFKEQKTL